MHRLNSQNVIFCDVGQGSATLVQVGYTQLLIDTGPNRSVLACLGRHMPLFDTTIEYIVISHPQKDHDGALSAIADMYLISHLISHKKYKHPSIQKQIHDSVRSFRIPPIHVAVSRAAFKTQSVNESALVVTLRSTYDVIFLSSDISGTQLKSLIPRDVTIFTVPHHGSKTGMYENSLQNISPQLAIISVGKSNRYGHPHQNILDYLCEYKIPVWRTDLQGELTIDLRKKNSSYLFKNIDCFKPNPTFSH